jgi:pimeloyl-ACP methyl ester carboxylesterase
MSSRRRGEVPNSSTTRPSRSGGTELAAYATGAGSPVVLLHGLGGAAANWVEVVSRLASTHRVISLDLPGHGGSSRLGGRTLAGFADAVADAIAEHAAAPALVAGHSFGGHLAVAVAARHPRLVRGLLLVAPAGIRTLALAPRLAVRAATLIRPGRLVAPLAPRLARRLWFRRVVFQPWFVSDPAALSPQATTGFFADMRRHADTRSAGRAMIGDDPRWRLAGVACPAVVLWGARDRQLPLDDAFDYARRLGARLRIVADCGHLVIGERPDAVADALAALDAGCA